MRNENGLKELKGLLQHQIRQFQIETSSSIEVINNLPQCVAHLTGLAVTAKRPLEITSKMIPAQLFKSHGQMDARADV